MADEDSIILPHAVFWCMVDQIHVANTFKAAIDFELLVFQWATSTGYELGTKKGKRGHPIYPTLEKALTYLKTNGHLSDGLYDQLDQARKTRNALMHDFAWKALLLGPVQSKELLLDPAYDILQRAWF